MKIVICTNCGAKYQLEDSDDVATFECSVCTGNLEELNEGNQVSKEVNDFEIDSDSNSDSVIVCCQNCGLKFKLDKSEDIRDFECDSCEGPLKYLDDELNKMYELKIMDTTINNDTHEVEIIDDGTTIEETTGSLTNDYDSDEDFIIVDHSHNEMPIDEVNESEFYQDDSVNSVVDVIEDPQVKNENVSDINESLHFEEVTPTIETSTIGNPIETPVSDENVNKNIVSEPITVEDTEEYDNFSNNFSNDSTYSDATSDSTLNSDNIVDNVSPIDSKESYENNKIVKNGLVFDNVQEYERYELTLLRTYNALKDSIKKEYLMELDTELFVNESIQVTGKKDKMSKKNKKSKSKKNKKESQIDLDNKKNDKTSNKDDKKKNKKDKKDKKNKKSKSKKKDEEYPVPLNQMSYKDLVNSRKDHSKQLSYFLPFIFGILFIIAAIAVYILLHLLIAMGILLVVGIICILYGAYKKIDSENDEFRSRIIREKLEELPEDFYIFYYTKPPYAKAPLNHVIVGPTGIFTILSQKYSAKQDKDKQKSDAENAALIGGASDIGNYMTNRNTLELTSGYSDNQTRFQFGNEDIQFDYNNKIKHKSLTLNEDLAIFLDKSGINGIYIEPLIGFVNEEVAVINVVLTNEDLFLEELLYKIAHGPRRLDPLEVIRIAKLLSRYSINCNIQD